MKAKTTPIKKSSQKSKSLPKFSNKKILKGVIISDKMDKTVVVSVERLKEHPVYRKKFKINRHFQAHDPKNEFKEGETVEIIESRPISKNKHWQVLRRLA